MPTSQNGWPTQPTGSDANLVAIPKVIGRVNKNTAPLFAHLVAYFDANIEDVDKGRDDWGYAFRPIRGQVNGYSNHASGTAIDLNATLHPRGKSNTFSSAQVAEIRKMLDLYEGTIRWGGDYNPRFSKIDDMHFEINSSLAEVERVIAKLEAGEIKIEPAGNVKPIVKPAPPKKASEASVWDGLNRDETLAVQKYLKQVTKDYKGELDGIYGPMLVSAVKKYQARQNQYMGDAIFKVDGHWGPYTQNHYEWVLKLQNKTNDWAASKRLGSLPEDGDYGHLTWRHVKEVQRVNGKAPRGVYWKNGGRVADGHAGPIYNKTINIEDHPVEEVKA